jgi:hypothetical protein
MNTAQFVPPSTSYNPLDYEKPRCEGSQISTAPVLNYLVTMRNGHTIDVKATSVRVEAGLLLFTNAGKAAAGFSEWLYYEMKENHG